MAILSQGQLNDLLLTICSESTYLHEKYGPSGMKSLSVFTLY